MQGLQMIQIGPNDIKCKIYVCVCVGCMCVWSPIILSLS